MRYKVIEMTWRENNKQYVTYVMRYALMKIIQKKLEAHPF